MVPPRGVEKTHSSPARPRTGNYRPGGARLMVARGWDLQLPAVQRACVYLPSEHCENLPTQEEALRLFERVLDDPQGAGLLDWARKHHEVIRRFGRFPHRNQILGRVSTPEEVAFLAKPGSRF